MVDPKIKVVQSTNFDHWNDLLKVVSSPGRQVNASDSNFNHLESITFSFNEGRRSTHVMDWHHRRLLHMEPAFSGPEKWQALVLSPSQGLQRKLNKKSQKNSWSAVSTPFLYVVMGIIIPNMVKKNIGNHQPWCRHVNQFTISAQVIVSNSLVHFSISS
jgi:hypothetical protein